MTGHFEPNSLNQPTEGFGTNKLSTFCIISHNLWCIDCNIVKTDFSLLHPGIQVYCHQGKTYHQTSFEFYIKSYLKRCCVCLCRTKSFCSSNPICSIIKVLVIQAPLDYATKTSCKKISRRCQTFTRAQS